MNVGLIGLPQSGKTTLFRALLSGAPAGSVPGMPNAHQGAVIVPDPRFDFMVQVYSPKRVSPATVQFLDGAARIGEGHHKGSLGQDFLSGIRQVDALVHVVDAFSGTVDPVSAARRIDEELLLADLTLIETRLERLDKALKARKSLPAEQAEREALHAFQSILEQEIPLRNATLQPEHEKELRGFTFLTQKPLILVANLPEEQASGAEVPPDLLKYATEKQQRLLPLCATIEADVAELDPSEEAEFLQALGIAEPARNRLISEAYRSLGLITFFTCGEPEVHAWTLREGGSAVEAAGRIHSDLARGFIRLEVIPFDVLQAHGSWEAAKAAGAMRLEMKDYVVKDGDVVYVRFKV